MIRLIVLCFFITAGALALRANVPAGIVSSSTTNVTITTGANGPTLSNGIAQIVCTTSGAVINQINYTYNNGSGTVTKQMLAGGKDGGELYWEFGGFGGGVWTYTDVVDPSSNGGNYAEVAFTSLGSGAAAEGDLQVNFSMLRGSPGFYVTLTMKHHAGDIATGLGEMRTNIYISPDFNWMSVSPTVQRELGIGATFVPAFDSPQENSLCISGVNQGLYDDKYKFSQLWGTERVWGWGSINDAAHGVTSGANVGIWNVLASSEYYNGGPLKPELMDAPMVNMLNGGHYYMGTDSNWSANEEWTRVQGPYFVYLNNIPNTITDPVQASQALYNDAVAQGVAEVSGTPVESGTAIVASTWPYSWFNNTTYDSNYAQASQRGTVTGQIVIDDPGNPNASGSNMWVGVVQQPATADNVYDFQEWYKAYQFWVKADNNGNFTIPSVISGSNYTLYAFGPGAEGTFMSQNQTGGNPPWSFNLPASPFSVAVTGGSTTALGQVAWTPTRVGPTVFEIGYPDRTGHKFRHGDDWYVGDIGPSPTEPSPVWTKFFELPYDFPNGVNYTVGLNQWPTDWFFIQPILVSTTGGNNSSSSTINFNLASAPSTGGSASLYLGLASDYYGACEVYVNGTNLGSTTGVTASPSSLPGSGFVPSYTQSDSSIREACNGAFSDERLTFPASLLQAGSNTITLSLRQIGGSYFANHFMYDYIRLELTGYVPPAPASIAAYSGNNGVLLSWPVTPGATSYNISSTTTSGSNYSTIATGVVGPVCGSGYQNATYLDTSASNGTTYYYVVQAANTTGTSGMSPESAGVTPSSGGPEAAPDAPTGLVVTATDGNVSLTWNASSDADYYTIERSTLVDKIPTWTPTATVTSTSTVLSTITLSNTVTGLTYTDSAVTNGTKYAYTVIASNAAGSSSPSGAEVAKPVPATVPGAPVVTSTAASGQITLNWSAVPGAVGYIVSGGTSQGGPYTYIISVSDLTYTITGLSNSNAYYYTVEAMNAGGGTVSNVITATPLPNPPAITSGTSATGAEGATFSYQIKATNSPTNFSAAGLPAGLGVDPNAGLISGTLMQSGTFVATIYATNVGGTGQGSLTIKVSAEAAPVVSNSSLTATGTVGFGFNYEITASNNPVSFDAAPLPDGISIDPSTGLISGTPTATGTFQTTISAINYGGTNSEILNFFVVEEIAPFITSPLAVSATNAYAFNYQIRALHNPTSFSATGLPANFSINDSTGLISGTPSSTGTFFPTINAINFGGTDTETLAIDVLPTPPSVVNSVLTASGSNGSPFSYQIQATNNPTGFSAADLPYGLSVDPTSDIISGTLGGGGIYNVTLIASNPGGSGTADLVLTVTSTIKGMKGVYQGLVAVAGTNQGLFNVTLTSSTTGAFTGSLIVPGARYAVKGTLDPVYGAFDSVEAQGRTTLNVDLSIDDAVPGVNGNITVTTAFGSITNYSVESTLLGTYTVKAPAPVGVQGYYTVVIPADSGTDPSQPAGTGYGTMSVGKTGAVTISAKLGDGTAVIAKAPLHADGKTWTLYVAGKTESIAGTLTADEGLTDSDADAPLDWIRYANVRNVYYPAGFTIGVDLLAAKYTAPTLTTTSGTLTLTGGNLPSTINDDLTISSKDAVTVTGTTGTSIRIVAKSGAVSGLFRYPLKKPVERAFGGIIYVKPSPAGYGMFLGTDQSGSVEITP